jgi:hypothetical protein
MATNAQLLDVLNANITANTILNKADWDTIDNKHVVGNVRKTQAYKCFTDIINNPDDTDLLRDHQAKLANIITKHLSGSPEHIKRRPARIIYSTPTGSGKTFSSLLISKLILQHRFSHTLLIYSVPTKEVLKRVGTDCEAHGIVYWTAGKIGDEYFIRRPYSCRTSKENAGQQRGEMFLQLLITIAQSIKYEDKIKGRPRVILADIEATAKLLEVLNENPDVLEKIKISTIDGKTVNQLKQTSSRDDEEGNTAKGKPTSEKSDFKLMDMLNNVESRAKLMSWLDPSNIVLFFDEPNMGIHISNTVLNTVLRIINNLPDTAILASATLKNWESLPDWWKGRANPQDIIPVYLTVTCEPFNLPIAELSIYDSSTKKQTQQSVFDIFTNHSHYVDHITQTNTIALGQLIRHFTEKQCIDITGIKPESIPSYRKNSLLPVVTNMDAMDFAKYRNKWSDHAGANYTNIRESLSKTGITLIATLNPHKVARELTGYKTDEEWATAFHDIRRQIRSAETKIKAQEREIAKAEKLKSKRDKPEDGDSTDSYRPIKCKFGDLELYADELDELSEESLVFLSRGIAISSPDADAGIKLQFQKAIYSRPEHIMVRPAIYILIVDYASIYGFDCPGVDKIILYDDLGDLLSHEDIVQFIGRLRRDGQASFSSFNNLVKLVSSEHNVESPDNILDTDITALCKDYIKMPIKEITEKWCITQFKCLCRRVYAGITYSQSHITIKLLEYIIKTYPTQIKHWRCIVSHIMNYIEISNAELESLLTTITPSLINIQPDGTVCTGLLTPSPIEIGSDKDGRSTSALNVSQNSGMGLELSVDSTIRNVIGLLFSYVNSDYQTYYNWYSKYQHLDSMFYSRLTPIIEWLKEMDEAASSTEEECE